MDTFFEQIVTKRKSYGVVLLQTAIWVFGIFIGLAVLWDVLILYHSFFILAFVLVCAMWVGMYFLSRSMNIEYEYSVTNGYFDLDKIIAKSKRRRLTELECKNVERFGKYNPAAHEHLNYDKKIIAVSGKPSDQQYFLTLRQGEQGHTLIVITPDERVLGALTRFIPKQVQDNAGRA